MKILVFIPIYRPSIEAISNIEGLFDDRLSFYLHFNSNCTLNYSSDVHVAGDGSNDGIAKPFNECLQHAAKNNCDFVLFIDQDTVIDISEVIGQFIELHAENNFKNVAALPAKADSFQRRPKGKFFINSATFFNVDLILDMGGFNEDYFVDGLDYDTCIRLWRLNYQIYDLPCNYCIDHSSLQPDRLVRIFRRDFPVRKYSESRYRELNRFYFKSLCSTLIRFEIDLFLFLSRSALAYFMGRLLVRI